MNNNHLPILFFLLVLLTACGGKKQLVETPNGAVEMLSARKAAKKIAAKPEPAQWVNIKANVTVVQDGSSQKGGAEIRLKQDSIMWVELADPIIGIKVIRAFAMEDTVAFINRIDRTYFAGSYQKVEEKLGTGIPFPLIFNVFMAEPFSQNAQVEPAENRYLLSSTASDSISMQAEIEPFFLDMLTQRYITKTDMITVAYGNFIDKAGYRYPQQINVEVTGRQQLSAQFLVKSIDVGKPLKMPFKISSKYEQVD